MKPKISVVMSVYNESNQELSDSINSILNQSYQNYEFIVVDDNPTSLRIRNFLLNINSNSIKLLFNKKNLGAALSRNRGIQHAKGKYIAIMDADDISSKYRLSSQISFLYQNSLDFVFPNYQIISINGSVINSQVYNFSNIINQHKIDYVLGHIQNISINSGWLVNKNVFINLNGYRNLIIEDYDFISRAIICGYKLGYQSNILMKVRFHNNSRMRTNSLKTFLESKYISNKLNKKLIFHFQDLNNYLKQYLSKKRIIKFNKFVMSCHFVKYEFSIFNIVKFLYFTIGTRFAKSYLYDKIITKLKMNNI